MQRSLRGPVQHTLVLSFLVCTLFPLTAPCLAQPAQAPGAPYSLRIPVDEISLTFHASDPNGKPLTQLTARDLNLADNGKRQNGILMLQSLQDLPIRAGFLFDISASMREEIDFNRFITQMYVSRLIRKGVDQAFVMQFDTHTLLTQDWTDKDSAIALGSAAIGPRPNRLDPLTAIFDSLYTTCRDRWGAMQAESTGNFILLFSDGEDDASHAYLSEAVDMCQRRHIAIYVFQGGRPSRFSDGRATLRALAQQTGGRVFDHPRADEVWKDLQIIEAEQRYQYRLVYKPSAFTADGSFHRVRLQSLVPGARIVTRSGYYAFPRP
jgi:Ca-activated chloride channel family protein